MTATEKALLDNLLGRFEDYLIAMVEVLTGEVDVGDSVRRMTRRKLIDAIAQVVEEADPR